MLLLEREGTAVRNVLFTLLFAGLFLLLLSALVVSVSPEGLEPAIRAPQIAVLVPQPVQAYEANGLSAMRPLSSYPLWLYAVLSVLCLPVVAHNRDANGRVLTAIRYENSVYQVFRPEVAGG